MTSTHNTSNQTTCYTSQQQQQFTQNSPQQQAVNGVSPPQKPTYISDHIQSGHSALNELMHSPTSSSPTTQYASNYSTPSPNQSTHLPQEANQQYSTIDMTALSQASPVRHQDEPSTSYQSPSYCTSSSPAPSSPLSTNGSIGASSPQPNGRKRGFSNNQACRDSRKKKKVKREELKDREMELITDNEVQKKKIAKLEVEVAKTRDIILRMMAGGAAAAAAGRR